LEALINIIISIILVFPLGIIGIAIGSLVAMIFRTIQYGYYSSKHLLSRPLSEILKRYVVSAITILLGLIIILFIPMQNPVNFFEWILNGFIIAGVMIFITLLSSIIFYREELINLKTLINRLLKLRPKNGIKNN
jgi:peptidoglycan biosynthesis protein MviN/MurJ (putative lipid II flippase)